MTDLTTPVPADTSIAVLIGGKAYGLSLIGAADGTLVDPATAQGQAAALEAIGALAASGTYELVTPSDTIALPAVTRAITIGGAGNLTVKRADGAQVGPIPVVAGQTLAIAATHVMATGTTATGILAQA